MVKDNELVALELNWQGVYVGLVNTFGLAVAIICASSPCALQAQQIGERTEGAQRVCLYRNTISAYTNAAGLREYRVGLAENCPMLPPNPGAAPMPVTAQLVAETMSGESRECIYEQSGLTWRSSISADRACPLAAGMLTELRRQRR